MVANQLEMSLLKRAWLESTGAGQPCRRALDHSFPHGTRGVLRPATGSPCRPTARWPRDCTPVRRRRIAEPGSGGHGRLVAAMAAERNTTGEAIVLGWLMRHPAGIAPVIGTANPARILACAGRGRRGRGHDPGRVVPAVDHGPGQQHPLGSDAQNAQRRAKSLALPEFR